MEKGVQIGDLAGSPKLQKFFEPDEWTEFLGRFFGEIRSGHCDGMMTAVCRKPLWQKPEELARSICFEFDLPYPGNLRMGLKSQAIKAFSMRLGLPLEY